MNEEDRKFHHRLAVQCFNGVWGLLEKTDRTPEEDIEMIHMAHCSRYHWGEIGTPLEFQRGEWQISRVYSVLGMGESALRHGEICNRTCVMEGIGDFDLAFSLEALTRAHSVMGNFREADRFRKMALEASKSIEDSDNRDYFMSELSSISSVK